jgi:pimeloyl-ACP methyl ester carboxylesterase
VAARTATTAADPWGREDGLFPAAGARAYLGDVPDDELHLLDGGYFAPEEYLEVIADLVVDFLDRHIQ